MNLDELKEILQILKENDVSEFELEREGVRIRIRKNSPHGPFGVEPAGAPAPVYQTPLGPAAAPAGVSAAVPEPVELDLAIIKAPIVGTFYRAADPGSQPFVEVGDTVRVGQVLCIIEAMKLMNEIESEHEGEIAAIYVESGQPVQYGERLFAIKTK